MAYTEEQIQAIQAQLMKQYVDDPLELDSEILSTAEKVSKELMDQQVSKFEFQDTVYEARSRFKQAGNKQIIYVVFANIVKYKLAGEKYIPYTASCEIDTNYTYEDNLKTIITAFLEHLAGVIHPEVLDDED